jgi:hypothetical protein
MLLWDELLMKTPRVMIALAILVSTERLGAVDAGTTIDCVFSPSHLLVLENGKLTQQTDTSSNMLVTFTSFAANSRATLVGNSGSAEVFYEEREGVIQIAQLFGSAIRTLTSMNVPQAGQSVAAVHSRHVWLPGTGGAIFSQWQGNCRRR